MAESNFSPDGTEIALFPDAVAPLPDAKPTSGEKPDAGGGSKLTGLAIAIGVAVAVFALVVIMALGKKSKPEDTPNELAPPPPPSGGDFRG